MVFFVECGNNFTLSYGDIDDDFYDSVLLMYEFYNKFHSSMCQLKLSLFFWNRPFTRFE